MKPEEATKVIEQALNQGFIKGAYNLQDAVIIAEALKILNPKKEKE
jgi:hypothetical protein